MKPLSDRLTEIITNLDDAAKSIRLSQQAYNELDRESKAFGTLPESTVIASNTISQATRDRAYGIHIHATTGIQVTGNRISTGPFFGLPCAIDSSMGAGDWMILGKDGKALHYHYSTKDKIVVE
jgi:hypothetical protein